jgi:hypothetical protein
MVAMSDEYVYWNCTNSECACQNNRILRSTVDYAVNKHKKLAVYCGVCGFAPNIPRIKLEGYTGTADHACNCIPFTGNEALLPTGGPDLVGEFIGFDGNPHELIYFLKLGINPANYRSWIKHNKKPNHIDLKPLY